MVGSKESVLLTHVDMIPNRILFGSMVWVPLSLLGQVDSPPQVDAVEGVFKHGSTVVIRGVNFGPKSSAAPAKFDSFESGTSGASLASVDPSWKIYRDGGASYSNVTSHSGSLSVGAHIADGEAFATNYFTIPTAASEIFVSYWWRTANADSSDNTIIKMTRINSSEQAGGGGVYGGVGNTTLGGTFDLAGQSGPYFAYHNGVTGESIIKYLACPPNNTWFRVEMYKKLSTPGLNDGIAEVKLYGVDQASDTAAMTRAANFSFLLDTVLLGLMDGNGGTHDYEMYIDDVYIDTTRARVEICDSPTWAARTEADAQPALEWLDTSVTVSVNQGSIQPGSERYLYIIDSSGRANTIGYPIRFQTEGPSNHAHVLAPIGNRSVLAGQQLQITVEATDADGDALEYRATGN